MNLPNTTSTIKEDTTIEKRARRRRMKRRRRRRRRDVHKTFQPRKSQIEEEGD
jgi:hypothetical protein